MNAISQPPIRPGVYSLPPNAYHDGPGVSKSMLDIVHEAPALLEWDRKAPVDTEAKTAVDVGTALHTLLLEPDRFDQEYVAEFQAPKGAIVTADDIKAALDERGIQYTKSSSKQALCKVLLDNDPNAPVSETLEAEWAKGINGRTVLSLADARKLGLMRDSVMAHPFGRKLIEAAGEVEKSFYWDDDETGELCRCRIDKVIPRLGLIMDVKTTGEIARFSDSIREYRYHCQDPYYSDGYQAATGDQVKSFVFLVVGSTRDRGRYPVRLKSLTTQDRDIGRAEIRADLNVYAQCRRSGVWPGIETISLPAWYIAKSGV